MDKISTRVGQNFGGNKMRCKICQITHKNTGKYDLWTEYQVCRICGQILDLFTWNGNNLGEYWKKETIAQ